MQGVASSKGPRLPTFRPVFWEVYAGSARMSRAMTAKGFCVGPPIELTQGWTLEALLFLLLLGLCLAGRISFLWLGPQCSSFSLAGHPRLRSVSAPWGFDVLDYDTLVGNFHMHLSLVFLLPKCSPVKTPSLKHLSEHTLANFHGGDCWLAFEFRVDQCQFGVTYQKAHSTFNDVALLPQQAEQKMSRQPPSRSIRGVVYHCGPVA